MTNGGGNIIQVMGENVRALRQSLSLSQEELAFRAGVDRTYISQIERGVGNPSVLVLVKIAATLGVGLQELLAERQRL